jgi:hypothetical protein
MDLYTHSPKRLHGAVLNYLSIGATLRDYWWESQRKQTLARPRRRWEDNIRMELGEVGWGDVDWIGLAQDRNRRRALVN